MDYTSHTFFDATFNNELRRWFLFYPKSTISINCFSHLLTSKSVLCSPELLGRSDIIKESKEFAEFENEGIIQCQEYGVSSHQSTSYAYHHLEYATDNIIQTFLSLCTCYEKQIPFSLPSNKSESLKKSLNYFQLYLNKEGIKYNKNYLNQYLKLIIKVKVPNRFDTTKRIQYINVENELKEKYEFWNDHTSKMEFTFEQFVEANLPIDTDYIYISPSQFLEIAKTASRKEIQHIMGKFNKIEPTEESINKFIYEEETDAFKKITHGMKVAKFIFQLTDIKYQEISPPFSPELPIMGIKAKVNYYISKYKSWLLSLREFEEYIDSTQLEQIENNYAKN